MTEKSTKYRFIVLIIGGIVSILVAMIQTGAFKHATEPDKHVPEPDKKMISGTVVDDASNSSIGRAIINVVGRNEEYITEDNGNFKITLNDLNLSEIRLRIKKSGYLMYDKSVDLPADNIIIMLTKDNKK